MVCTESTLLHQVLSFIYNVVLLCSKHKIVGYWVSFLDGLQRVILFTTSHEVWSHVMGGQKTERASTEVTLSLSEVGLSLVNDERGVEVAYIGIRP